MRENRMRSTGLNAFRLSIRSGSGGALCGTVRSDLMGRQAEFTSLSRMVILLEEWMDLAEGQEPVRPLASPQGADFEIQVLFRQNFSWQGRLLCLRNHTEAPFRSVLELLIQLETILTR